MLEQAKAIQDQLVAWRRDIHMHPELSFQEVRTANLVTESLAEMGIEAQAGVGKTGVVGYLGEGSPVIGIRADMDALPIQEDHDVPYASQTPGAMHACGHDAHTAMLLGAARLLSEMADRPAGQIRFLFQPSEEAHDDEGKSGAPRMIEDGAMEGIDHVIALHVISDMPANTVMVTPGGCMAAEDSFFITLTAAGGHGAFPHLGGDTAYILAHVIQAINAIRARRIDPTRHAAVSIGTIHGGTATNVIPNEIKISGTMRSLDNQTREDLKNELAKALEIVPALGGEFTLSFRPGYPVTYNDPKMCKLIDQTVTEMLGAETLLEPQLAMGSEDFSYMTQLAPGAMFMLGAKYDEMERPHHTPVFDIDEAILSTGTALLAETTCRLLQGGMAE